MRCHPNFTPFTLFRYATIGDLANTPERETDGFRGNPAGGPS